MASNTIPRKQLPSCGKSSSRKGVAAIENINRGFTRSGAPVQCGRLCFPYALARHDRILTLLLSCLSSPELLEACRKAKPRDIAALRVTRKRNALQNERALRGAAVDSPSDGGSGDQQLRTLDAGVKRCGRKYNEAKANADKLEEEVRRRSDELLELERESKALDEMLEGNNEDARKIARLSAEIKEVNDDAEGVLEYRRKLLHMKQRLDCNSDALDEYIGEMSETLAVAQAERDKNKRLLAELESGLTCASIELDDTLHDAWKQDESRNRELAKKQIEASDASKMDEWNKQRLASNTALHDTFTDAEKPDRERLKGTMGEKLEELSSLRRTANEQTSKLAELEALFAHAKQKTGVNSLSEMTQKVNGHHREEMLLTREQKDAEERLNAAKASLAKDEEYLDRIKTNGVGETELSHEIVSSMKRSIASEKANSKIAKSTNKRLEDLLVGLREGGIGLYNRLLPFHSTLLSGDAPVLGEMDSTNAVQAASDTMETIRFAEEILLKMLAGIGGVRALDGPVANPDASEKDDAPDALTNCRITPKKEEGDGSAAAAENDADYSDSRRKLKEDSQFLEVAKKTSCERTSTNDRGESSRSPGQPVAVASPPSRRSSPKHADPMDRVQAFLTEAPLLF